MTGERKVTLELTVPSIVRVTLEGIVYSVCRGGRDIRVRWTAEKRFFPKGVWCNDYEDVYPLDKKAKISNMCRQLMKYVNNIFGDKKDYDINLVMGDSAA